MEHNGPRTTCSHCEIPCQIENVQEDFGFLILDHISCEGLMDAGLLDSKATLRQKVKRVYTFSTSQEHAQRIWPMRKSFWIWQWEWETERIT